MFFFFQAEDGIRDRTVTGVQTCALPIWADGAGEGRSGLRGVFRVPGIRPALAVAFVYIIGLTAVLTYYIPAVRAEGLTRSQAAIGFTLVNIVAGLSRPIWGRRADRGGGTRRTRTLRETGIVGAAAAVVMLPA